MTTATTTTVFNNTTTAGFRAWVAEVIAELIAVGLTQTADTGQINTSTVTLPGTSTIGGFAMFSFNDTLQASSPIFIKLEFGSNSGAGIPLLFMTVGSGSNGSGTVTQVAGGIPVSVREPICSNLAPSTTINPYVSRFCYNTTLGVAWFGAKMGGTPGQNVNMSMYGIAVCRTCNGSGVTTGDGVYPSWNGVGTTGQFNSGSGGQLLSTLTGLAYPSGTLSTASGLIPLGASTSAYNGQLQVAPVLVGTPVWQVLGNMCYAFIADIPLHATFSINIVGGTAYTFIQAAFPTGSTTVIGNNVTTGICLPYQ